MLFNNHSCFYAMYRKGTHHEMIGELLMISQIREYLSGEDIYILNSIQDSYEANNINRVSPEDAHTVLFTIKSPQKTHRVVYN